MSATALSTAMLAEALPPWLAAACGGDVRVESARPLSGGAVQENWALDVTGEGGALDGEHALVLRTDAPARMAASLDRREEFAVLHAAHTVGITVPERWGGSEMDPTAHRPSGCRNVGYWTPSCSRYES